MSSTYTVTKVKAAGEKQAHGKTLRKFYATFVAEDGTATEDCYWQTQREELNPGEEVFGRIEQGEYGPRFYTEQRENGSHRPSGGSSRGSDGKDDAWWHAKDRRISRAGMLQAVVAASKVGIDLRDGDLPGYVSYVNRLTDALLASLDERTPHPSDAGGGGTVASHGTAQAQAGFPQSAPAAASTGFVSDKQKTFFERLLKKAGVTSQRIAEIDRYVIEALPTDRLKKAMDALNDDSQRSSAVARLDAEASEWASKQTDIPWSDDE